MRICSCDVYNFFITVWRKHISRLCLGYFDDSFSIEYVDIVITI